MPVQPLGPTGLLAQSLTLPAGFQSMSRGGMKMQLQGMDGRKRGTSIRDWIAQVGDATTNASADVAADAQGGLYLLGRTGGGPDTFLSRYAPDGLPLWGNRINGMEPLAPSSLPTNPGAGSVAVDPSGNVIVFGYSLSPFVLETRKYSPAGQLLWGRTYSAGDGVFSRGLAVGASGAVYASGLISNSPSGYGDSQVVVKYSATGAFQWSRNINAVDGFGLSIDASENVYVGGRSLIKLNSAGTIQWAVERTSGTAELFALSASPTGETCAVGVASGPVGVLLSFDTSGALLWQRGLTGARWMSVMRSGQSIYCAGWLDGGPNDLLLAEYDTAGNLKWQQRVDSTGDNWAIALADIDASSMAVAGTTNFSGTDCLISRYPKSGARPGPLGPYTIVNSTATTATPAEAYSSYSPASTSVGSDAASALTDTAISLPATIYPL